jgi:hypothetical protein
MTQISTIKQAIEASKKNLLIQKRKAKSNRVYLKLTKDEFLELMQIKAMEIFLERGELDSKFILDNNNKHLIGQLYYYITGSDEFEGSLSKGIYLWSKEFGTGKTVLLRALCNIINELSQKKMTYMHCKNIAHKIKETGAMEQFTRRPMLFDDFGREQKEINDYGTVYKPMVDITFLRYDHGTWTFGTSQRNIKSFYEIYGGVIVDRMRAMFNEFELTGNSRRK